MTQRQWTTSADDDGQPEADHAEEFEPTGHIEQPSRVGKPRNYERLRRMRARRLVAGVAAGTAEHLNVPVLWVRAAFVAFAAFGGAGAMAYALLWLFVPQHYGRERPESARERQQGVGLLILGVGLTATTVSLGPFPPWLFLPFGVALIGAAVVWREADASQRDRWRGGARSGVLGVVLGGGGRAAGARIVAGAALVVAGIVIFLVTNATLSVVPLALLAVLATLIGVAVLTVPWWLRLVGDLNSERASRIRTQERAEIAAHLHDSVLQTLALIQKQADSSRDVRKLARGQERELRHWLYGPDGYGRAHNARSTQESSAAPAQDGETAQTFFGELARVCGEVEDSFELTVQQVGVGGDCPLTGRVAAIIAAAKEAIVNAAKHSGADEVSVYAEVQHDRIDVFVRDRGSGFEPDDVPGDRHGLSSSIRGRMQRNGGSVGLRTSPGSGTEIHLEMSKS